MSARFLCRDCPIQVVNHPTLPLIFASFLLVAGCAGKPLVMENNPAPVSSVGPSDASEVSRPGAVEFPNSEFSETASGLKYRILRNGSGKRPEPTDTVYSHYKGWLDDGSIFDSSYRRGDPTTFGLDQVIAGWTEGLQLVGEGGMIELDIPYFLGYGDQGSPPAIPPKARLHFVIELIRVQ